MSNERYPVPLDPPEYVSSAGRVRSRKKTPLWDAVAAVFVGVAIILVVWLAIEVLLHGRPGEPLWVVNMVAFWAICAYLALPRIHQLFTTLYVPDYFIGRTRTSDGVLGDPVNLAFDGGEDDIHAAMRAAGWVLADEITLRSLWGIIVSSVLRRSYPGAPVSSLYLFGRRHAFAYQQEVAGNAAQRHHIRFWPTPECWVLPGGERVAWVAAASYDRSVGLSLFTGQVTHKIDADIDAERDYIVSTLRFADPAISVRVIEEFATAYHSRNGGGDSIRTDGDLPVVDARGASERYDDAGAARTQERCVGDRSGRGGMLSVVVHGEEVIEQFAEHHVPPLPLFFAGAFSLVGLAAAVVLGTLDALALVGPGIETVLWILTVLRLRWAWVGLMASASLTAVSHLTLLDYSDLFNVGLTALAVFVVFSVSAASVRDWVRPGLTRRSPEKVR